MSNEAKPKSLEYPDVPDKENLPTFDLGIQEDPKGNTHSQLSAFILLIVILTLVIAYYFLS